MSNNIGYSSIYPASAAGAAGPIGPTGSTGAAQTIRGATGATGLNSNYITQVVVASDGTVQLILSDGTSTSAGILQGPTGVYAGLTAYSLGGGYPILKGVCGGITLDFYNFRTSGLLGLTYDADGTLRFTISANTTSGGISASTENNRIVYVKEKTYIMSTDLIPEATTNINRIGNSNYGYVNFGGETAGRNVVADINDSILSIGPIQRGEKIITLDDFYDVDTDGITLDVSRATVYQLTTPIGIKGFKYDTIPDGQIMSVTLVVEGDDVWNFPSDVIFDAESKPIFYPGTNILHMWRTNSDSVWKANFTARAFGVTEVIDPGVRGSCCYIDVDGIKHCEDYVTQSYCNERTGTFEGSVPCNKNSCIINSTEKDYDGVCCSEGRCISDIDPNFCQTIGGYFISGITCGQVGRYPDNEAENYSDPESDPEGNKSGLCYNQCKTPTICCKNGECLGHLTEEHCKYIGGISVKGANSCSEASCCDHIKARGACCKQDGETYTCSIVDSPYDCNESGGVYMGKNTTCEDINCACRPNVCYECVRTGSTCECSPITIEPNILCSDLNYYSDPACGGQCSPVSCHTCNGTDCNNIQRCGSCEGYSDGPCVAGETCQTKTCYSACSNCECSSVSGVDATLPCEQAEPEYPNESCGCDNGTGGDCEKSAICFWCFPEIVDNRQLSVSIGKTFSIIGQSARTEEWLKNVKHNMEAPYRASFLVDPQLAAQLENYEIIDTPTISAKSGTYPLEIDSNGLIYFTENWDNVASPVDNPNVFGTKNSVWAVTGKYKCYYVGAYNYSNNSVNNKLQCVRRFGYEELTTESTTCKLCDETKPIKFEVDDNEEVEFARIEPYNEIPAPFPPIWGRMSSSFDAHTNECEDQYHWFDDTFNLRLLSEIQIRDLIQQTFDGNLKSWLKPILDDETPFNIVPSNNGFYKNAAVALGHSTYGITQLTTSIEIANSQTYIGSYVSYDGSSECILPRYEYDPYLKGISKLGWTNALRYPYGFAGGYGRQACGACFGLQPWETGGYWFPRPTGVPPVTEYILSTKRVYPPRDQAELDYYGGTELLSQVGEKYLVKGLNYVDAMTEGGEQFEFKYGILGRNLRYNIDSFRSATVFYHEDVNPLMGGTISVQTMGYSDNIVIPIARDEWIYFLAGCGGGCNQNCDSCPGCIRESQCGEEAGGSLCVACAATSSGGLEGITAVGKTGLLVSSTATSSSPFAPTTKLQPKTVKIAEGICVDIMCSDCSSYESC
jgi:hypothetical protein